MYSQYENRPSDERWRYLLGDICTTKLPGKFVTGMCTSGVALSSLHRGSNYFHTQSYYYTS